MISQILKRDRPVWIAPVNNEDLPPLHVFNSLTNEKNIFKPQHGKKVEWYGCGPTVYDVSHMGHARTYISIDILRRIMKNYFNFDVHYVMNITDIDDKIIKRARQNHLYEEYSAGNIKVKCDIKEDIKEVLHYCEFRLINEKDIDMKDMLEKERKTVQTLLMNAQDDDIERTSLISIKDALSSWLDKELGNTVTDNAIFEILPRHFEDLFHKDMRDLNILPPDELTRVSEYIPQIVSFIVKIMERGLAYESNNSVYFDTETFARRDSHYYAKLVPTAYGNESLLQEGEGALSTVQVGEKRSNSDFALWKASKKGEPSWESPWGLGRPGWHIECSAMAGDKCGSHLDIHTGGVDLKFPHHDNELAQSEAHYGCVQWVNYFLHTGHLTISGCKMSKSLKNFISIKDALARHSWRQLRFAFLMSSWKDTLDYSDDLMTAAVVYEKMLLDFFFNMHHIIDIKLCDESNELDTKNDLSKQLEDVKLQIYSSLCDSFDTRECMIILKKLVEEANKYSISHNVSSSDVHNLSAIRSYVLDMIKMFGAAEDGESLDLVQYTDVELSEIVEKLLKVSKHFEEKLISSVDGNNKEVMEGHISDFHKSLNQKSKIDKDVPLKLKFSRREVDTLLSCLAQFRQKVRLSSRQNKWKTLLTLCDDLRDRDLVSIGVRFQDLADDTTATGLYPSWAVLNDEKKGVSKDKNVATSCDKGLKMKLEDNVDPKVMFSVGPYEGQYSCYDETGLPSHTHDGQEMSKTSRSKLKKLQMKQEKKHKAFFDSMGQQ